MNLLESQPKESPATQVYTSRERIARP